MGAKASFKNGRPGKLLAQLTASGWYTVPQLARALGASEAALDMYMSGDLPIPLEHQRRLAVFLVRQVPAFARQGYNMLSRVEAALKFQQSETKLHNQDWVARARS